MVPARSCGRSAGVGTRRSLVSRLHPVNPRYLYRIAIRIADCKDWGSPEWLVTAGLIRVSACHLSSCDSLPPLGMTVASRVGEVGSHIRRVRTLRGSNEPQGLYANRAADRGCDHRHFGRNRDPDV